MDGIHDSDASGQFGQIGGSYKIGDEFVRRQRAQRKRAEQDDAGMRAGRVLAQAANRLLSSVLMIVLYSSFVIITAL